MKSLPTAVKEQISSVGLSIKEPISILCHKSKAKQKKRVSRGVSSVLNSPLMKGKENATAGWNLTAEQSYVICAN